VTYIGGTAGRSQIYAYRNAASGSTQSPLVNIIQTNASDDQPALNIQNDGTGGHIDFDGSTDPIKMTSSTAAHWRFSNTDGYVDIGAQNSAYAHFYTDRGSFYFGQTITNGGSIIPYDDNQRDLGSSTRYFRDFYTNTIHGNDYIVMSGTGESFGSASSSWPLRIEADNSDDGQIAAYNDLYLKCADGDIYIQPNGDSWDDVYIGDGGALCRVHLNGTGAHSGIDWMDNGTWKWAAWYHTADTKLYFRRNDSPDVDVMAFTDGSNDVVFTGNITAYSDKRLKTNIKTIDSALDKVNQMRGVTYDRIDYPSSGAGVLAQELEEIAPELVDNTNKYKGVSYGNLTAYLVESIKELSDKMDKLENRSFWQRLRNHK
jgi:hypothetical protein